MKRELIEDLKELEIKISNHLKETSFQDEELFQLSVKIGQYIEDNSDLKDKGAI